MTLSLPPLAAVFAPIPAICAYADRWHLPRDLAAINAYRARVAEAPFVVCGSPAGAGLPARSVVVMAGDEVRGWRALMGRNPE